LLMPLTFPWPGPGGIGSATQLAGPGYSAARAELLRGRRAEDQFPGIAARDPHPTGMLSA